MAHVGLDGVIATTTALSHVDGERGQLLIAGFPIETIASRATFEETTWLLWNGELPSAPELQEFRHTLTNIGTLPPLTIALLRDCASRRLDVIDALRAALLTLPIDGDNAAAIVAHTPAIVAAYWRLLHGQSPIASRTDLSYAGNFLFGLRGRNPHPEHVRALDTYLNTVIDHGLNASTFTARVIVSTRSDLRSAIIGAIGALKGPLHGGAPGPALDMVFEIGSADRAEAYLRKKLESGERLMGFGHRIYKVRDPRVDVLGHAAERLFALAGDMSLYTLARRVESQAIKLLGEYKPGRRLQTNMEFYTALVLHGLGLPTALFTPAFAMSRLSGWIAHAFEQRRLDRLIRPQSEYVGPRGRRWLPLNKRAS